MSIIHHAAANGDVHEVERLINIDPSQVDALDDLQWTPLMRACDGGHEEVCVVLLRHGAAINKQDTWGQTALLMACQRRRASDEAIANRRQRIIWLLLQHGADPNSARRDDKTTPLLEAATHGQTSIVKLLLEDPRTCIDRPDVRSCTAVSMAGSEGHAGVLAILLEAGANPLLWDWRAFLLMDPGFGLWGQTCLAVTENWEVVYLLYKARLLSEAARAHEHRDDPCAARPRKSGALTCLLGRLKKGIVPLPTVSVDEANESVCELQSAVLCHFVTNLKSDLAVELLSIMGK